MLLDFLGLLPCLEGETLAGQRDGDEDSPVQTLGVEQDVGP